MPPLPPSQPMDALFIYYPPTRTLANMFPTTPPRPHLLVPIPRKEAQLSTEAWGLSASHLAGTVRSLYHRCEPWYAHAACTMRQGVLAGRSDKSERSHRCRPFMLNACGLPVLPQVLSAADAVTNMMKLMPPLG